MSGFQSAITISDVVSRISKNEFLLPAFQRDFRWDVDQITNLFDSLMKGYPINSMLFWKVKDDTKSSFKFYKFLNEYIEVYQTQSKIIGTDGLKDFYAILDGQQRLTSLYIGLCGSYAFREYYKSKSYSENSYPTRHLYFNVSNCFDAETGEELYHFDFIPKSTSSEADLIDDQRGDKWFKVSRVLSLHGNEKYDLDDFIEEHGLGKDSRKLLKKLDNLIFNTYPINYYEEDEQNADKAVNVFVRINSGGTALEFSDILMAIAVANWHPMDAKTEINNLVNAVRDKGFSISKDYILKAFLFLYHKDVRFKVHSFNFDFMSEIMKNWESIRDAIDSLFDTLRSFGLNSSNLTSNNATLPILYYIYHRGCWDKFSSRSKYKEDREDIKKWLFTMLLRKVFGGQSDSVLTQSRKAFSSNIESSKIDDSITEFPSVKLNKEIKKLTELTDDIARDLLLTQKDSQYSFPLLSLLYPNLDYRNNNFHQDHLHPAASYESLNEVDKETLGWEIYNSVLNLQMLDANENMSKNDMPLEDWIKQETSTQPRKRFLADHLIPDTSFALSDFALFIQKREELLLIKLKAIIS